MKREIEDKVLKKTVNDIGAYTVMKAEIGLLGEERQPYGSIAEN